MDRNLKFLLAVIAVLAAAVVVWVAWPRPEVIALRLVHTETDGAKRTALDALIAGFEAANRGIRITQVAIDDDAYQDGGLAAELAGPNPPDIWFQWAGEPMRADVAAGHALELGPAFATGGWQEAFVPLVWSESAGTLFAGKHYLVPDSIDVSTLLWFNPRLFTKAGVARPTDWPGLVATVTKIRAAGIVPVVIGNEELWPLGNWAAEIAAGTVPADAYEAAFRREAPFDVPPFEQVFAMIAELRDAGAFNFDMNNLGADPAMTAFFASAAAIHPIGSWLIPAAADLAPPDFAYDAFETPLPDGTPPSTVLGTVTGYMVNAKTKHPDEAIAFLRYLTAEENQATLSAVGIVSPLSAVLAPPSTNIHMQGLEAMIAGAARLVPPPDTAYPVPVADAFYRAAANVASGDMGPKEALIWLDAELAKLPR